MNIPQVNLSNNIEKNVEPNKKTTYKRKPKEIDNKLRDMDYNYFFRNAVQLNKLKLDELKHIAKMHNLKFSGTKSVLADRINVLFQSTKPAVKIQARFRGWVLRESLKLRGPALKKRSMCVNDTDFITMDPINEIPIDLFYSYKDSKDFIYGFNLSSLIQVLKKNLRMNEKIENPYTREAIDGKIIANMVRLYRFCFIMYPDFKNENEKFVNVSGTSNVFRAPPLIQRNIQQMNDMNRMRNAETVNFAEYQPVIVNNYQISADQYIRINRLREIRTMTINQRINNLFIEIDHLGNYTQASWFNLLERNEFIALYRILYDIWYYRNNFTNEVRYSICPFLTPFYNVINVRNIGILLNTSEIKQLCLIAIENLVYTGFDDDHRRLGTMHALSALTVVSLGARISMPWLYESVAF